jgi:UDP-N-acetyl-D-galactosamine dehydrogenase
LRNTKIVDLVASLKEYNAHVDVYDPWIDLAEAKHEYDIECLAEMPASGQYAAVILAVGHHQFIELGESGVKALGCLDAVIFDVKSILPIGTSDGRL